MSRWLLHAERDLHLRLRASRFIRVENPGAQATKEAVEGATGLKINYWVLIDLKGFEALVDAVGGITMDVYRRVLIGGGSTKIHGYAEAGRNRHLSGYEALWFARSRSDSSDYDRVLRQKVMRAMLNQFDLITVRRSSTASRQPAERWSQPTSRRRRSAP